MKLMAHLILLALVPAVSPSSASILVEPYAGYAFGSQKGGLSTTKYDVSGLVYGGRLGVEKLGFMVGADYMAGTLNLKSGSSNRDFKQSNVGVFVGFDTLIGIRAYASYYISPSASVNNTPELKLKEGTAYRIGVGFKPIPFVSVNLDYYSVSFKKYESLGITQTFTSASKVEYVMLGVSLPFSFL